MPIETEIHFGAAIVERIGSREAEGKPREIGLADSAHLFAMQNLVVADAAINCWNDKFH